MKKNVYLLSLFALLLGLTSCPGALEEEFSDYKPVLMSREQLEASVGLQPARPIAKPGKLYHYGQYIFINELYKGVHIINNQDPTAPQNIGFIRVPGNVDFAVKENVLYADNAVDLVALDIQNLQDIKISKRIRNTFPALPAPDNLNSNVQLDGVPKDAVIVAWELKNE